jgi:ATP-dependent DNA helicase RecG
MLLPLSSKLTALSGVGGKLAEIFAGAGFHTIEDLLWGLPYRYIDRGSVMPIGRLETLPNQSDTGEGNIVTLMGNILDFRQSVSRIQRMPLSEALLGDDSGTIRLIWFNQPFLSKAMKIGDTLLVWGAISLGRHGFEMRSPTWERLSSQRDKMNGATENPFVARYLPIYRRIAFITGKARQKLIDRALRQVECPGIFLPLELSKGLPDVMTALRLLHNPPDDSDQNDLETCQTPAHKRLATEELFAFALGIELRRAGRLNRPGYNIPTSAKLRDKLKSFLPFSLTNAQRTAFKEIVQDLTSGRVMHRMLQGDVGSGKTLVAFLTMAMAAETDGQAALLVPTEVLARQHAASFSKLLGDDGHRMQLLLGAMKNSEKKHAVERIANGQASYIIGTHSLFQEGVSFCNLRLIVVDEQHRFGVKQREAIKDKGIDPHWLVMSATPIPRSLALAIFGDLDQSVLDELPPGRRSVKTCLFSTDNAERAWNIVERELSKGRQAFVVSPAIDTSESESQKRISLRDISKMEAYLRSRFPDTPLAIVHGRLKTDELTQRMADFVEGRTRLLLATTVIEVGMDVPNATAMVVDHAERFGLSQLHQLRGRIGRGEHGGTFIMISDSETDRLEALTQTSDGFRIAQRDLEIRGPGEFFGARQSGIPRFQVADLVRDRQLLTRCRKAAAQAADVGLTADQQAWLRQEQARLKMAEIS